MREILKNIYLNFREILLCGLFYLVSFKKLTIKKIRKDIKTILFIRIDRIGDLVLSTPTIKALKQTYPSSKLIVLASKSNHAVLKGNPYVDVTLIYNGKKGYLEIINMIKRLKSYNFDLGIDPYADYELKTALITLLSGARQRIGFPAYGREFLFNHNSSKPSKNRHFVDLTLDVLNPLNIKILDKSPEIYITANELEWSTNWIKKNVNGNKPILAIHPGAYYESQRWPIDSFAELINRLQKDNEFEFIVFGGSNDDELLKRIASLTYRRAITFKSRDIRKFIALLSNCKILICNNSGPLHIAVATNTPTISFMGPTIKERWMPLKDIHRVLRIDNLQCIGCNAGHCRIKTHDCMRLISPTTVVNIVKDVMAKQM